MNSKMLEQKSAVIRPYLVLEISAVILYPTLIATIVPFQLASHWTIFLTNYCRNPVKCYLNKAAFNVH